jgi:hypothetical protein
VATLLVAESFMTIVNAMHAEGRRLILSKKKQLWLKKIVFAQKKHHFIKQF